MHPKQCPQEFYYLHRSYEKTENHLLIGHFLKIILVVQVIYGLVYLHSIVEKSTLTIIFLSCALYLQISMCAVILSVKKKDISIWPTKVVFVKLVTGLYKRNNYMNSYIEQNTSAD